MRRNVSILLIVWMVLSTSLFSQTIVRVNCGGDAYTDHYGKHWFKDQPYTPGSWGWDHGGYALTFPYPIKGTVDDPLYQAERNALEHYRFTVPNGDYVVTLKFAELFYKHVGERIYHVDIEGKRVLSNFDMIATAGFATAIDFTFTTEVKDGRLDMHFVTIEVEPGVTIAHANVKAISVEEQGSHEAKLWTDRTNLNFGRKENSQYFEVRNGGELPLTWNLYENPDVSWISQVSPTNGTLLQGQAQAILVKVDRLNLTEGKYQGKITVESNGGNKNVDVTMIIELNHPIPLVEPAALDFGSLLTKRTMTIKNVGTAPLNWTANNINAVAWLKQVTPMNGSLIPGASQDVDVHIDRSGVADSMVQGLLQMDTNGGKQNIVLSFTIGQDPVRINCGGPDYMDTGNRLWFQDLGFSNGIAMKYQGDVINSYDDPLYQTTGSGMTAYHFPVQSTGYYSIGLHFAEFEAVNAGERVFHVSVEDSAFLNNFDIFAAAGSNVAVSQSVNVEVKDHQVDLIFTPVTGVPQISAVELFQIPAEPYLSVTPTVVDFSNTESSMSMQITNLGARPLHWKIHSPMNTAWLTSVQPDTGELLHGQVSSVLVTADRSMLTDGLYESSLTVTSDGGSADIPLLLQVGESAPCTIRVNAGGPEYLDAEHRTWEADRPYTEGNWGHVGGAVFSARSPISDTENDPLYQSERWGLEAYVFDVPNGMYEVTLHFAEIYFKSPGLRMMGVKIEGESAIESLDIYARVGARKPLVMTFQAMIRDRQLNIDFVRNIEDPKISAIEVNSLHGNRIANQAMAKNEALSNPLLPDRMSLEQNYPNPFNMETAIVFGLPVVSDVTLEIYNLMGQKQATLFEGMKNAGYHTKIWNGLDASGAPVASGFYLYKITIDPKEGDHQPFQAVRKMVVIK